MKNIQIKDSYRIWSITKMKGLIDMKLGYINPEHALGRTYSGMYVEWYLHNIGYYLTKPFCGIKAVRVINLRFKDVDLEEK